MLAVAASPLFTKTENSEHSPCRPIDQHGQHRPGKHPGPTRRDKAPPAIPAPGPRTRRRVMAPSPATAPSETTVATRPRCTPGRRRPERHHRGTSGRPSAHPGLHTRRSGRRQSVTDRSKYEGDIGLQRAPGGRDGARPSGLAGKLGGSNGTPPTLAGVTRAHAEPKETTVENGPGTPPSAERPGQS